MHTIIYSLRTINGKSVLSIDLTGLVISENPKSILLNLPTGSIVLYKYEYLNKMNVYDDGKVFFIVCTKHVSTKSAFKTLMEYAIGKVENKVQFYESLKEKYQQEMAAA